MWLGLSLYMQETRNMDRLYISIWFDQKVNVDGHEHCWIGKLKKKKKTCMVHIWYIDSTMHFHNQLMYFVL
jgi:hypothetical protein